MAKGLFLKHLALKYPDWCNECEVLAAGLSAVPGEGASSEAIAVMRDIGVDLSEHRAQLVTEEVLRDADLILTMTGRHRDYLRQAYGEQKNIFSLYEFLGQERDIQDPFGWGEDVYRECRDEIEEAILLLLEKLKQESPDTPE